VLRLFVDVVVVVGSLFVVVVVIVVGSLVAVVVVLVFVGSLVVVVAICYYFRLSVGVPLVIIPMLKRSGYTLKLRVNLQRA